MNVQETPYYHQLFGLCSDIYKLVQTKDAGNLKTNQFKTEYVYETPEMNIGYTINYDANSNHFTFTFVFGTDEDIMETSTRFMFYKYNYLFPRVLTGALHRVIRKNF